MFHLRIRESEVPRCPFCLQPFGRPPEALPKKMSNFFRWTCSCRAVGVYDTTGNDQGEALMEALVLAAGGDWDRALSLEEGKEYLIKILDGYSRKEHRIKEVHRNYKSGFGSFVFIKLL